MSTNEKQPYSLHKEAIHSVFRIKFFLGRVSKINYWYKEIVMLWLCHNLN